MIRTPFRILLAVAATVLASGGLAVLIALSLPAVDVADGFVPDRVIGQQTRLEIRSEDLIEEPDTLPTYAAITAFFARQSALEAALLEPGARVGLALLPDGTPLPDGAAAPGEGTREVPVRDRGLTDLPPVFWFQLAVGAIALLISGWIVALRPRDAGARVFALCGLFILVFTVPAAIYSTRDIAMDGSLFRALSALNHIGAAAFGTALVCLFLVYPRPLVKARWLIAVALVYGAITLGDVTRTLPDGVFNLAIASQMLIAIILGGVQWWLSRRSPLDRAGLRWFLISTLVGASLFIGLRIVPLALGFQEGFVVSQGYAFGFFLTMHVGLALGLLRYRVFELDDLAYRIWLWFGGAALVLAIDFALFAWLQTRPWASISLALVIAGFLYFPLRQTVLSRILRPRRPAVDEQMQAVVELSFADDRALREARWRDVLETLYHPLENRPATPDGGKPHLLENGLALHVPAVADCAPRRLAFADGGRRLFTPHDARSLASLVEMGNLALESRLSYEAGAHVERERIGKDLHDHIGAQLLSALHSAEPDRKDAVLRQTLSEMRAMVNDNMAEAPRLDELMAELRVETAERLAAHDIALDWSGEAGDVPLSFAQANALRAILREAASNVVKHAEATRVAVAIAVAMAAGESRLRIAIEDDGIGFDGQGTPREGRPGHGLANIRARSAALGGAATWSASRAPDVALDPAPGQAAAGQGAAGRGAGIGSRLTIDVPLRDAPSRDGSLRDGPSGKMRPEVRPEVRP